ncbi:MAG: hypothetical protein WBC44_02980, partial [Planctomycetaceae bacterium]
PTTHQQPSESQLRVVPAWVSSQHTSDDGKERPDAQILIAAQEPPGLQHKDRDLRYGEWFLPLTQK